MDKDDKGHLELELNKPRLIYNWGSGVLGIYCIVHVEKSVSGFRPSLSCPTLILSVCLDPMLADPCLMWILLMSTCYL